MKIGRVEIDDSFYCGEDLYSDGAIEDEMLELVQSRQGKDLDQAVAEKKSWPILYHFSHIRGNILQWYPFTGNEKVLEIGAGCGAVTGTLLALAESVTAIELSMKRSRINALRNQDSDRLTIKVGNFEEMEASLDADFDVITLIGVFEYAKAYIDQPFPYETLLKLCLRHLKPGGRLILAIENRFGLKYWAGCTEDHVGRLFEGLNGYPSDPQVRTFTRQELFSLVQAAGAEMTDWYYPYPDYKFPQMIFSDRRLPRKGECRFREENFDRFRIQLFDEEAVCNALIENGLYPEFANSFLLVIGKKTGSLDTAYVRFSNERAPQFRIRTEICCPLEGGLPCIRKAPTEEGAAAHVMGLPGKEKSLKELFAGSDMDVNHCMPAEEGVRPSVNLSFERGETVEEQLDRLLEEGKKEETCVLLVEWADRIRGMHEKAPFEISQEFSEIFGEPSLPDGLMAAPVNDIDMVAGNLLIRRDSKKIILIDYEWTFFFPIPAAYIAYRFLHYYLETDTKRFVLDKERIYQAAGMTTDMRQAFAGMEARFQSYILGKYTPARLLYRFISPGSVSAVEWYDQQAKDAAGTNTLQVFYDKGNGFSEEDSLRLRAEQYPVEVSIEESVNLLRLDPGEMPAFIRVKSLSFDTCGEGKPRAMNGISIDDETFYFPEGDPQIWVDVPEGAKRLTVDLKRLSPEEAHVRFGDVFSRLRQKQEEAEIKIRALQESLDYYQEKIRQMEETKIWKLYRRWKRE